MKRWLIITASSIVVLVVAGVVIVSLWLDQPIYNPGSLASRNDLDPPEQTTSTEVWSLAEGVELYHFFVGAGRNILMVHGGPGLPTREEYPGLQKLSDRYRFHYYDQRGCGQSSMPVRDGWSSNTYENIKRLEKALGIGAQVADIERIRRILGDEQLIIIGHSYGAFLATLYASEFPNHVGALVLVSPADLLTLPPPSGGVFSAIRKRLTDKDQEPFDNWLERYLDLGSVFEKSKDNLLNEDLEFARFYQAALLPHQVEIPNKDDIGTWMIRAQYFSMGRKHDYRKALKAVRAPVLVIHGKNDIQPEAVSRLYSEALPNAEIRIINNAGHFPQYDNPSEFVALVSDFLNRLHP